jgi:peptide/nickel transport system substrate-binding protein
LTDAGYKLDGGKLLDKDGKPVEITVSYPISSKPRELIATYLQQQLKQLGISVKVDGKEFNAFIKQVYTAKDFDIDLGNQGGGFPDPDSYKSNIQTDGTQNASGYANPRIDDIFNQAGKEVDPAKRKVLYNEAQKTIADDSPVFFLYSLLEYKPMLKKIGGVTPSKGQRLDYNDVLTLWYNSTS